MHALKETWYASPSSLSLPVLSHHEQLCCPFVSHHDTLPHHRCKATRQLITESCKLRRHNKPFLSTSQSPQLSCYSGGKLTNVPIKGHHLMGHDDWFWQTVITEPVQFSREIFTHSFPVNMNQELGNPRGFEYKNTPGTPRWPWTRSRGRQSRPRWHHTLALTDEWTQDDHELLVTCCNYFCLQPEPV